jgi:hypothetical protein
MYTNIDFRTKKAVKQAVKDGQKITVYQHAGIGQVPTDGEVSLEGPHFPKPHTWYATAILKDGVIVKVLE